MNNASTQRNNINVEKQKLIMVGFISILRILLSI